MRKSLLKPLFLLVLLATGMNVSAAESLLSYTVDETSVAKTELQAGAGTIYFGAEKFETHSGSGIFGYKCDGDVSEGSTKYALLKPSRALQAGDVIYISMFAGSLPSGSDYGIALYKQRADGEQALATLYLGKDEKNVVKTYSYTVKEGDGLAGLTEFYAFRAPAKSTYITAVEITAGEDDPPVVEIPTPVISPKDGSTVAYGSEVTITYDEAYTLNYTTDGSDPKDPTANVKLGASQPEVIAVDQEGTFTVKAYLSNKDGESDVVTATYTVEGGPVTVGVPTFSPEPGAVEAGTKVTIQLGENAQSVIFTLDGTDPRVNGETHARNWTVTINEATTIKAYCQAEIGGKAVNSEIVEASYTIKEPEVLPESNVPFSPENAMPTTFDDWGDNFLITKTDVKEGDKFTFIAEPVEVPGWEWGPQILPKSNNQGWNDLAPALIPNAEGKAELVLTKAMADEINTYGGLRIQGMAVKVLAVQFEASPAVEPQPEGEIVDLIDRFTYTWNSDESQTHNPDKSITYNGLSWGGIAAWMVDNDVPADWSGYEKLVFEFAEPTTINVQGYIQTTTEDIKYWGNPGITKLECPFEGKDLSQVRQVALQLSDPATVVITKIYLVKKSGVEPAPEFALTFDPKSGTEVEVDDEITLTYDDETFLLYYTTDGSDPKSPEANTISAWGTGEVVTVKGEGDFVIKAYLENRKTDEQSEVFTATYPIKAVVPFDLVFDPKSGTEVEVDDEITLTYNDEAFLLYYTTDGSDPKSPEANTISAWGTGEVVTVKGEGNFVIKAYLENRKTDEQSEVFTATYPIKAVVPFDLVFDPKSGTEVEVDDEITLTYDDETFLLYYTTDGSDPKSPEANTISAWGTGEVVTVKGEGDFVIKAYLENRKTNEQSEVITATYPIKAVPAFAINFDPESGSVVEVDDIITMSFDGDVFNCSYTTDGSDPRTSMTMMTAMPNEFIIVKGEGEFVINAVLENLKTQEVSELFTATYTIKSDVADVTIATKANGYGTYCSDKDLNFAASDAKAFIARVNGNRVYLTEVEEVPAGTGILVQYAGSEVTVPVMEGAAPITEQNDFVGVLEDTEVEYGTVSILSLVNGEEGFYRFLGTIIPANKAYFPTVADNANAKLSLVFDETDAINSIVADAIEAGDAYNLNGQRVLKSYKGIVVVNGKKYVKK